MGHAAFAECESLTGNLIIPSTVSFIGHSCFKGTGFNGDIVIPSSVTTIGSAAFIGIQYDKIFCKSVVPPKISKIVSSYGEANAFSKTKYLGIPKGSEEAYRNARYWEDFLVIEGVDFKD